MSITEEGRCIHARPQMPIWMCGCMPLCLSALETPKSFLMLVVLALIAALFGYRLEDVSL